MVFSATLLLYKALVGKKAPRNLKRLLGRDSAEVYRDRVTGRLQKKQDADRAILEKMVKKQAEKDRAAATKRKGS